MSGMARQLTMIVAVVLLMFVGFGCASGMTDEDVQRQVTLWRGAVEAVKTSNTDATVTMALETSQGAFGTQNSVYMKMPISARLVVSTNTKPDKAVPIILNSEKLDLKGDVPEESESEQLDGKDEEGEEDVPLPD